MSNVEYGETYICDGKSMYYKDGVLDHSVDLNTGQIQWYNNSNTGVCTNESALDTQVGGNHYKSMKMQPIEFIMANDLSYCEANIIKYICRHKLKGQIQDIEKVIHYAQILKEEYERSDS